jgi:molybdate transport system substrate-binding protein
MIKNYLLLVLCNLLLAFPLQAGEITIAAASDLKFAMDDIITAFRLAHPADKIEVVYGSSGNFHAQIQQGAPYDLYFSADISYALELERAGFAAAPTQPYATGRIVLWSTQVDASTLTLANLTEARFARIAIANPAHAPYGKRAEEALQAAGVWDQVEAKLVFGENIAQTAQFVQSGAAQIGVIALALAVNPELAAQGDYFLIPDSLHEPLEQGFIITARAKANALASEFAAFMAAETTRAIMGRYGFVLPDQP